MANLDLPSLVLGFAALHRVDREGPRGDGETTEALLAARGFPAHAAALGFEARYGGLRVFEPGADPPALVVGPYSCLASSPYSKGERDLVPVIFGADDAIYSLDTRGRGWTCAAMVESVSRPSARDGRQLLAQAILWRALVNHPAGFVTTEGVHGAERASERGLSPLADATSDHESWWADASQLVVEIAYGNGYAGPMTYATARARPG